MRPLSEENRASAWPTGVEGGSLEGEGRTEEAEALLLRYREAGAMSTTVCAQTRTLAAKHGTYDMPCGRSTRMSMLAGA